MRKPDSPERSAADSPGIYLPPPALLVLLWAGAWSLERLHPTTWGFSGAGGGAGIRLLLSAPLMILGVVLDLWALREFLRRKTHLLPFRPARVVVVEGPYRWTRNPMYLGMLSLSLGLALLVDSLWALLASALFFLVLDGWVIPREERYLTRRFGNDYRAYCRQVSRWLGRGSCTKATALSCRARRSPPGD